MKNNNVSMLKKSIIALSIGFSLSGIAQANEFQVAKVAKPSFQHVNLTLDPAKDSFSGSTTIKLEVLKKTKTIELSGRDYTAQIIKLIGDKNCDMTATMLETHKVNLECEHEIKPGKYTLNIDFTAPYNKQSVGLYKTIDKELPYLFTQFEMSDARRAFPVFDEPSYKIPFQLTITAPTDQKVYANTPELKTVIVGDMTTHHFDKTPPIPSYLVALAVGPFVETKVEGMPIEGRIITSKEKQKLAQYAADEMPAILATLEEYFGSPYPYKKLDSVGVPEFPFGAMENAGLVTYREDILLVDADNSSQNVKQTSVSVVAHELAHQWYGNLVTMKWWNDLWLNEAFASWMAAKVTHKLHPEFGSDLSLPQNNVMAMDARLSTKPIRKPIKTEDDIMDGLGLAYSKGSAVLSMVENWIGEEDFKKGIQAYMKEFAFKNASASDLWNALAKASGKDVPSVLKSFIEQSSFPLVSVKQDGKTISLSQSRFVNKGVDAPAQLWSVPVTIKYGRGDEVKEAQVLLNSDSAKVELDFEPEWIYPDANAMGYYRWVLEDKQLDTLLTNAADVLTVRERRAFISASDALLDAGLMSGGNLLKTLGQFIDDTHPRVVSMALGYIQSQKRVFIDDSNEDIWAKFITKKAQNALNKYGVTAKKGEEAAISKLRPQLISLLAFEGKNKNIINLAKEESAKYIKDSTKVDPYTAGTYLEIAAFYGDEKQLTNFTKAFETTQDPQARTNLLMALSYFGNKHLQLKTLDYMMTDKITASDMRYIMSGHTYKKARKARFQNWVYTNYDALSQKLPPFSLPHLPSYTGAGCDAKDLKDTQNFFTPKLEATPAFGRTLSKIEESVNDCIRLKNREIASVNQYLKQL